ncbi:MAG: 50S ribosomal protein L3 N(5)-glutamine methyltransferase [Halofilum sp. (in: g-proteobacteria)]|nr:50S ribosomal protein L3 N(5)-glutamine methyltransferase [Halofilum sp. (in: g-proteobacteria)]
MSPETDPVPGDLRQLVDRVEQRLHAAALAHGHGAAHARDEAAWLVLEALGRSPVEAVDPARPVTPVERAAVGRLLARRIEERRPLAYLTGRAWFAGLEFEVDERVLVPRSPLAEPIAERFRPWLPERPLGRILEIGTGSGCIAVACALAFPEARIDATDIDAGALELASRNVERHGVGGRVELFRADVYRGLPAHRRYDLIVSNPPYVDAAAMAALPAEYRHEPPTALAAGTDGLDVVERIVDGARARLTPDGLLVVEVGRGGPALERRYPRTPFTWLELAADEVDVFVLPAADLPR